jgi:hypothetical protein
MSGNLSGSNRLIVNLLTLWVPVQPFATPVRLRSHDAHYGVGETIVDGGIGLLTRLHRLQPVHQVGNIVIVWTNRIWAGALGTRTISSPSAGGPTIGSLE